MMMMAMLMQWTSTQVDEAAPPLHAGIPRRRPPIIWQMDACSLSTPYTPYFSISVLSSPFTYIAGFHPSSQKESLQ